MRLIILLFVLWTPALLAEINSDCAILPGPAGESAARTRTIRFPDGREITILGHNHGDRSLPFKVIDFLRDRSSIQNSAAALAELVRGIEPAIRHARADLRYLESLLRQNPDLKFVAVEMTGKAAQTNLASYELLHKDLRKTSELRGLDLNQIESLSLVTVGPVNALKIEKPELFTQRNVFGFESEDAIREYENAGEAVEATRTTLRDAAAEDGEFLKNIEGTDLQFWSHYGDYTPADEERFYRSIEGADIPAAYRGLTLAWSRARLREMNALKRREDQVAAGLAGAGQSGVLVMGLAHLDSVAAAVRRLCLRAMAH